MKVFVGADHNGFVLKNKLISYLKSAGYDVADDGDLKLDPSDDFPIITKRVVSDVLLNGTESRGIVLCGSGQGACMAANRFKGIRACLGYDQNSVRAARNDDDSNVLCLPARYVSYDQAKIICETWLNTEFAAASRYIRRIKEMDNN